MSAISRARPLGCISHSPPDIRSKILEFQTQVGLELYRRREGRTIIITPAGEAIAELIREPIDRRDDSLARL